jgi:LytS/YehU family sensor histidine kinase
MGGARGHHFGRFDMLQFMTLELPIYLMLLTGGHATLFFRREQQRAASLARARLEALRMQLHPHFLFNTLNTIAGLIHEAPDKADAMLTALSELLRMSLETSQAQELSLDCEIDFIERYLRLMHARFEDRVRYEFHIAPETRGALVPPMLLQPIVENAVEHGLQPKPGGGLVVISASRDGETLRLSVADDGVGVPGNTPKVERIGLGNTRARLHELYGERASLTFHNGTGLTVEIALPFRVQHSP